MVWGASGVFRAAILTQKWCVVDFAGVEMFFNGESLCVCTTRVRATCECVETAIFTAV